MQKTSAKLSKPQSEIDKQLVELSAKALDEKGQTNLANRLRTSDFNFSDVVNFFAQTGNTNTLSGYLFGFIAKQFIKVYDIKKIYGDLFVEGDPIDIGAGFSYIEQINNMVGTSSPINYQTSTQAAGTIAFGESFSNGYFINLTVQNLPFENINSNFQNWITLNITIPSSFASFSGLTPIKANEILSLYEKNLANSRKMYYYYLGNQLFNYFIQNSYFANEILCNEAGVKNAKGEGVTYTPPTNLIEALQLEIIPFLEYMQQLHWGLNCGFTTNNSWGSNDNQDGYLNYLESNNGPGNSFNLSTQLPWVNYNTTNVIIPNTKAVDLDDLVIIMSVKVSAALKGLMASNYLGLDKINIETDGNKVVKLCGVKVIVAGSNLQLPQQVGQGQIQTTGTFQASLLPDNQIVIMEKDTLTYHKYYDEYYETNELVASMVKLGRQQIGYLPFLNQWKNGIILTFNPGVLTNAQYLTVKTIANS